MFDTYEVDFILWGFENYCTEQLQLQPTTVSYYTKILEDYLHISVVGKVKKGDYSELFNGDRISKINRRSNSVRPTLLNLLEFLYTDKFIEDEMLYLRLINNIKKVYTNDTEKTPIKTTEFLTPNEIRNLLSDKIEYKTLEEEKLLPVITSLAFFCMYKQADIMKLKIDDIDIEKRVIRNIRRQDEESELIEWIYINDDSFPILKSYLDYRASLSVEVDELVIFEKKPITNQGINSVFGILKRNANKHLISEKSIHPELLNRSMMLYLLDSTNGEGIYDILMLQERNQQFEYAFNTFLSIKRNRFNGDFVKIIPIENLFPSKPFLINEGSYSEDNDIKGEDLKDFDMENNKNHQPNKVIIQRLVRDSRIARKLKEKYNYECQLCGYKLRKADGTYTAEAHHIKPYNKLHRGDDNSRNLIVLCPNCHSQFDDLYFAIHPETKEIHCIFEGEEMYHKSQFNLKHQLGEEYLIYTWNLFEEKRIEMQKLK
ncbi:hypothetical protein BS1321_19960 [Peribacillus simplex NBRC 15720 = DSM 1321]|uniref:HNH nuclease domain-containing protein n=2 Tax=Peribacillus simplex TaxID=1478 RepID=A0A223EL61_9BACI|nr:hypothetical protein BS1321_19960 [Peribacillus simplex NBRC 15720 = DSM 1321]